MIFYFDRTTTFICFESQEGPLLSWRRHSSQGQLLLLLRSELAFHAHMVAHGWLTITPAPGGIRQLFISLNTRQERRAHAYTQA